MAKKKKNLEEYSNKEWNTKQTGEVYTDLEPKLSEDPKPKYYKIKNDAIIVLKGFTVTPQDLASNQALADILIQHGLGDQLEIC